MTLLHLPLPPKEASPNWRGHWGTKLKATNQYRRDCKYYARLHAHKHRGPTTIQYCFRFRIARRRDPDNFVARMKAGLDGLRDAGIIADDSSQDITMLPPQFVSGAERDEVVVEIVPATPTPKRLPPQPDYDRQPEVTR